MQNPTYQATVLSQILYGHTLVSKDAIDENWGGGEADWQLPGDP